MRLSMLAAVSAMSLFGMSGCAIIPGMHVEEGQGGQQSGYRVVPLTAQALLESNRPIAAEPVNLPAADTSVAISEYRLGLGDSFSVIVWDHPELTNPTGTTSSGNPSARLVGADGMVYYPYVGTFKAAGKTVAELRNYISKELSRVIQNPQVDVQVASYAAQRVYISGEVKNPGIVVLDDKPKGIFEALADRGGISNGASQRTLLLTRKGVTHTIDLAALFAGEAGASNLALLPGDRLYVPNAAADQVSVLGEVEKPQTVALAYRGMSLIQALASAGGLSRTSASDAGVLIFRNAASAGASEPQIYALDMSQPQGVLIAGEFQLKPRDVVYVKATDFAKYNSVINQLLPTISAIFQLERLVNR